jgi:hypothetical protein
MVVITQPPTYLDLSLCFLSHPYVMSRFLTPKFAVTWQLYGTDKMQISIKVQTLGWFAFGIGPLMVNADIMCVGCHRAGYHIVILNWCW